MASYRPLVFSELAICHFFTHLRESSTGVHALSPQKEITKDDEDQRNPEAKTPEQEPGIVADEVTLAIGEVVAKLSIQFQKSWQY